MVHHLPTMPTHATLTHFQSSITCCFSSFKPFNHILFLSLQTLLLDLWVSLSNISSFPSFNSNIQYHLPMLSVYSLCWFNLTIFTTSTIKFLSKDEFYLTNASPSFENNQVWDPFLNQVFIDIKSYVIAKFSIESLDSFITPYPWPPCTLSKPSQYIFQHDHWHLLQ